MRLGDFLVDLAGVVAASRSIATKHAALRARQFDAYKKSSSILRDGQKPRSAASAGPSSNASAQAADEAPSPLDATPTPYSTPGPAASSPQVVSAVAEGAVQPPKEFRSAPWAGLASSASPASTYVDLKPQQPRDQSARRRFIPPSVPPNDETSELDRTGLPAGIDLSVFRSARTAKILTPDAVDTDHDASSGPKSKVPESLEHIRAPYSEPEPSRLVGEPVDPPIEIDTASRPPSATAAESAREPRKAEREAVLTPEEADISASQSPSSPSFTSSLSKDDTDLAAALVGDQAASTSTTATTSPYQLRESRVPASRLSRLWNYSGLAAGMFAGAIGEGLSRAAGGGGQGSVMLSAGNMERLVAKLSRMRGAALKIGQMVSFQDSKMLPAPIQEVLQRVQDSADYMPAWQRDQVLKANLGTEWSELFSEFEDKPIAAASIGQVHGATLKSNGAKVAVKIQFPGVANSINSDLDNIGMLLAATRLLPKGLYLNKTIDNARTELAWECDYVREAKCSERYRSLLADEEDTFVVPKIYPEACGKEVITMQYMEGTGVTKVTSFTQEQRDWIGTQILRLCLREITEFHFMQTDPNWTNFLFNPATNKLELLDFGASREFPERFINLYVRLLEAASRSDRGAVKHLSEELGYLTGHESKAMVDAHVQSVLTLAEPFTNVSPKVYDFRDQTITERVKALIPVMLRERLAPPPEETYSLHRKLSGAFLLCARLGSQVRCRELFAKSMEKVDL